MPAPTQAHFERLFRLAIRLGHPHHEAEDLAQECLLALTSGGYRGESTVETWLYRVLWNKHADLLRRNRPPPSNDEPPMISESPLERTEIRDRLHSILWQLPDLSKAILVLRYFENLPYAEISNILDRPIGTLKADCFRALEDFYDRLTRRYGSDIVKEWL